jgi:hypothetical protein
LLTRLEAKTEERVVPKPVEVEPMEVETIVATLELREEARVELHPRPST